MVSQAVVMSNIYISPLPIILWFITLLATEGHSTDTWYHFLLEVGDSCLHFQIFQKVHSPHLSMAFKIAKLLTLQIYQKRSLKVWWSRVKGQEQGEFTNPNEA